MNVTAIIIEMIVFAALFTIMAFATTKNKDDIGNIHNYPEDIQQEYFKTHPRQDVSYRNKKLCYARLLALLYLP